MTHAELVQATSVLDALEAELAGVQAAPPPELQDPALRPVLAELRAVTRRCAHIADTAALRNFGEVALAIKQTFEVATRVKEALQSAGERDWDVGDRCVMKVAAKDLQAVYATLRAAAERLKA